MSATTGHRRAAERIGEMCDAYDDARTLRLALLEEIRRVILFDAYAWLLTDPDSEVGCAPVADVPWLRELPRQIRLKYLTSVNRWTSLRVPVALLRAATDDHPEASLVWREMLADYGVDDVASMVFRDRFGCWAFLELWRIDPAEPFAIAEAEFLTNVAPPITAALRRCQGITFATDDSAPERAGPVVLVLSPELQVRAQTPHTDEYLRLLVPPDMGRGPVPAGAYNVAAQLLAVEAGIDDHPPVARVSLSGGRWLTLRASRIGGVTSTVEQDIAVTIETSSPAERTAVFVRASGLSAREGELVRHLVAGSDTRRIAEQMFLSEHTVQDHLKSIFAKTGTHNRRSLVARITGP